MASALSRRCSILLTFEKLMNWDSLEKQAGTIARCGPAPAILKLATVSKSEQRGAVGCGRLPIEAAAALRFPPRPGRPQCSAPALGPFLILDRLVSIVERRGWNGKSFRPQPICLAICSGNCYIANIIARSWAFTGDCDCLQIGRQRCSDRRKASRFTKKLRQDGRDMSHVARRHHQTRGRLAWLKASKRGIGRPRNPRKRRSRPLPLHQVRRPRDGSRASVPARRNS